MKRDFGTVRKFDYVAFAEVLCGADDLVKVYFACSTEGNDEGLERFYKAIDYKPYFSVKTFERKHVTSTNGLTPRGSEKQVDVYLATQIVALAYENAFDVGYLVSGDEDFVPAIEIAQQKGKILIAVSIQDAISGLLKRKADTFLLFDDDKNERMKIYHYRNFVK